MFYFNLKAIVQKNNSRGIPGSSCPPKSQFLAKTIFLDVCSDYRSTSSYFHPTTSVLDNRTAKIDLSKQVKRTLKVIFDMYSSNYLQEIMSLVKRSTVFIQILFSPSLYVWLKKYLQLDGDSDGTRSSAHILNSTIAESTDNLMSLFYLSISIDSSHKSRVFSTLFLQRSLAIIEPTPF